MYHQAASARLEMYQVASMCLQAASARLELYQATLVCHLRLLFVFLQVPWPNGRGITNAPYGIYLFGNIHIYIFPSFTRSFTYASHSVR